MVSRPTGARRPTLPQNLLQEIDDNHGTNYSKQKNSRGRMSRKDARKQERLEKKKRKADFFSSTPTSAAPKHQAAIDHPESPKRKKAKIDPASSSKKPDLATSKPPRKSTKTALEKLAEKKAPHKDATQVLRNPRSQVEREEDAYIAYLEAKLGYNRGKASSGNADDGLDGAHLSTFDMIFWNLCLLCLTSDLLDFTTSLSLPGLEVSIIVAQLHMRLMFTSVSRMIRISMLIKMIPRVKIRKNQRMSRKTGAKLTTGVKQTKNMRNGTAVL
jgi:hypothetical protein